MGSSVLNGKSVDDFEIGFSGKLYWIIFGVLCGVLIYKVIYEGVLGVLESFILVGKYVKNNFEILVGDGNFDDFGNLCKFSIQVEGEENFGIVWLLFDGIVYCDCDCVIVVVQGVVDDEVLLIVNGVVVDVVIFGKKVIDFGKGILCCEFFG